MIKKYKLFLTKTKEVSLLRPHKRIVGKYNNMKFEILLNKNQICIIYSGCAVINKKRVFVDGRGIFEATSKYAITLYILIFRQSLKINHIYFEEKPSGISEIKHKIYSLIDNKKLLDYKLNINQYLDKIPMLTERDKQAPIYVILVNYIMATTQNYEIERFNYLWRAYNSFYKFLAKHYFPEKEIKKEGQQIKILELFLTNQQINPESINSFFNKPRREKSVINFVNTRLIEKYIQCFNNQTTDYNKGIFDDFLKEYDYHENIDIYVKTQLAYYYRCKIFHGELFIGFINMNEDYLYQIIKIINIKIKEIIESNIFFVFHKKHP